MFGYENKLTFPMYILDQIFENSMDFLPVTDENKSHYVYIKDFGRCMFHKTRSKNKQYFCKSCLQCFSSRKILKFIEEHKGVCLSINCAQSLRFKKGIIDFKIYFKQIPVPFEIYADLEANLEGVESYEGSYSKSIKTTFLIVLLTNLFVLAINLVN